MNVLCKLLLALVLLSFPATGKAQEIEQTSGLVCDEQSQLEQFFALTKEGATNETALAKVNETDSTACMPLTVAYVRGEKVSEIKVDGGKVSIYKLTIIAVQHMGMWRRVIPAAGFAGFFEKETGA